VLAGRQKHEYAQTHRNKQQHLGLNTNTEISNCPTPAPIEDCILQTLAYETDEKYKNLILRQVLRSFGMFVDSLKYAVAVF